MANAKIEFENFKFEIRATIDRSHFILANILSLKMLAAFPNEAESHYLCARVKNENGNESEKSIALAFAERAVAIAPNDFNYNYYCGALYQQNRLYEFALPMLRKATSLEPKAPLAQLVLAECYLDLGKGDQAIVHFRAALKLNVGTNMQEMIRYKLAHCMVFNGQGADALVLLDRLLKDEGEYYVQALHDLVQIGKETPQSEIGQRVLSALAKNTNSSDELQKLDMTVGRLFENVKEYDKAFEHFAKSRENAKLEGLQIRDRNEIFNHAKAFYSADLFEKVAAYTSDTEVPVFVVGMPRSGTTLTEQIIAAHSEAAGVGEIARWDILEQAFLSGYRYRSDIERLVDNAKKGELNHYAKELLNIFHLIANHKKQRIVEKTPHNFSTLGYLHLICPRAKFIHIRRNPGDTFISNYQNLFNRSHSYGYDQVEYVKEYLWHEEMMNLWKSLFPKLILTINYEQLVAEPEHVAKKIFEHIGLPWEDQTLRFFENAKTVRTFSTHQVRNPVNTASVDRWRRYEKHLGPFLKALEDARFEYKYVPV